MKIVKKELIDNKSILISLEHEWQHEEIKPISESILATISSSRIIEKVDGGDREYIRFEWQGEVFHLQFEWYGQSIWFELETNEPSDLLVKLLSEIK